MDLRHVHLGNWKSFIQEKRDYVSFYVELSKEGVRRCEAEFWSAPKLHIREDGTGWLDDHVPKSEIPFLATFFLGLGNEATVKKPLELVDYMKQMLSEIMAKYV